MASQSTETPHQPLGDALGQILKREQAQGPSIGGIVDGVGEKGFGLVLMILSLPSALPVPAPGYSTPFGIVIGLIALQMAFGRQSLWLPARLRQVHIKPQLAEKMLGTAARFLKKLERFIRPRHLWITSRAGQAGIAVVIFTMAALMMLPIPLTNTVPAMVIFMIGVGLSEEDGLLTIGAFAAGCIAVLLYAVVIYLLITQGPEAVDGIKEWIKSWLGMSD